MRMKITMRNLASILGIDDMDDPCEYDMSDLGIKVNTPKGYKPMTNYVVKHNVDSHFELSSGLKTTAAHRTLVDDEWVRSKNRSDAVLINSPMQVVDMSVPETECYLANGETNHNTTPGGRRFASLAGV